MPTAEEVSDGGIEPPLLQLRQRSCEPIHDHGGYARLFEDHADFLGGDRVILDDEYVQRRGFVLVAEIVDDPHARGG